MEINYPIPGLCQPHSGLIPKSGQSGHDVPAMPDSVQTRLAGKLRSLREGKGLSRAQLAAKMGVHHNTIQKWEEAERKLTVDWITKLAPHLGTTVTEFLEVAPKETKSVNQHQIDTVKEPVIGPSNVYAPEKWPRDLPVMGIGECGPDGWSLWNGDIIQMAPRPPFLAGIPKGYAVYAIGSSMEPRYQAGELVYINPAKPPEPGCYVLVQIKPAHDGEAPRALLKRLVRRSGSKVTLEQFSPPKKFEIRASDIVSMHRVVGTGEG
jgi:transcriptional regulator with XRE-family HTH domain